MNDNEKREAAKRILRSYYGEHARSPKLEPNTPSVERELAAHDARERAVFAFLASVEVR